MQVCFTGIYKCRDPKKYYDDTQDPEYRLLYHCRNWTFKVGDCDEECVEPPEHLQSAYDTELTHAIDNHDGKKREKISNNAFRDRDCRK